MRLLALGLLAALWAAPAAAVQVEVFTTAQRSIQGAEDLKAHGNTVSIYRVDDIARINALLSIGLPKDESQAARVALARVEANQALIQRRYEHCAKALLRAVQYRLDRYPAWVFDGQAVVYGETDAGAAWAHYRRWQETPR